jgi:hypothetical protein
MQHVTRTKSILVSLIAIGFGTVAWLTPASAQDEKPLFYPPLPDAPRIQYLTSYSVASDVKEKEEKKSSWLSDFVLGEENPEDDKGPSKPYGVSVKDGQIYVVDTRGAGYAIFDVAGKDYRFRTGTGPAYMPKPINIEIDENGMKYVADTGRNQILVFDDDDEFVNALGTSGQFRPTDMLVDGDELSRIPARSCFLSVRQVVTTIVFSTQLTSPWVRTGICISATPAISGCRNSRRMGSL